MAKKYILVTTRLQTHKLYSQDIRVVHIKHSRTLPPLPTYPSTCHHEEADTQEEIPHA